MAGEQNQIQTPSQYPTATRIENGVAYDVSGKSLGPVDDGESSQNQAAQKDDNFFLKLGGQPVKPQEEKGDDFFVKLGGKPVQSQDPRDVKPTIEKMSDMGEYSTMSQQDQAQYLRQHAAEKRAVVGKYADGSPMYEGDYVSPKWHKEHPGEQPPVINLMTAGVKPGTINVHDPIVPLPGETFQDTMNRAIHTWTNMSPEQRNTAIKEEEEHNLVNAPATLATAAALGRVGPVIYGGAKGLQVLKQAIVGGDSQIVGHPENLLSDETKKSHPYFTGLMEDLGAFSNPEMAAMLIGSGSLSKLGIKGMQLTSRMVAAGFSTTMLANMVKQAPEFLDVMRGTGKYADMDADERESIAKNMFYHMTTAGAMATSAGEEFVRGEAKPFTEIGGKADELVARGVSNTISAAKNSPRAVINGIGSALGKTNDFKTAILRSSKVSSKQAAEFKEKVANVSEDLQAILNENKDKIEDPKSFGDAIDRHLEEYENELRRRAGATKGQGEPVVPGISKRISDRLDQFFDDNKGLYGDETQVTEAKKKILEGLLQSRGDQHLLEPNLFEAENIRRRWKREGAPQYATNAVPTTDAYKAGAQEAAKELRTAIDESYNAKGVDGVEEFRQKEANLIDVRDRLRDAQDKAEKMGEGGWIRSFWNKIGTPSGVLAIGLGHLNPLSYPVGAAMIGEQIHQNLTNPNINIERAQKIAARNQGAQATELTYGPASAPVNPGLQGQLASHFGEILGTSTHPELIGRFMATVQAKAQRGVALTKPEQTMLTRINEHLAEQRAQAEQVALEAQKSKPQVDPTLPLGAEPHNPVPRTPNGMSTVEAITHDYAHGVAANEVMGGDLPLVEIRSHEHPENQQAGSLMSAAFDWKKFVNEDGALDLQKVRTRIDDIATVFVSGGVANDIYHNIPFTENHGLGADLDILRKIADAAGFTDAQISGIIARATDRAREILGRPGVKEILEAHAEVREPGLSSELHASGDRMKQIFQDVKEHNGNINTLEPSGRSEAASSTDQGTGARGEGATKEGLDSTVGQQSEKAKAGKKAKSERSSAAEGGGNEGKTKSKLKTPKNPKLGGEPEIELIDQEEAEDGQGGHAGGGVASVEELNRPGRFVKIGRNGMPTEQGKTPDFNLGPGEAGYRVERGKPPQLWAGQETPTTKAGVSRWAKEVFPDNPKLAATAEATHPKDIIENEGLTYKGELVRGSGVHMFEHPDHPGKTAALQEPFTAEDVRRQMKTKTEANMISSKELEDRVRGRTLDVANSADEFNRREGRDNIDTLTHPHDTEFAKRTANAYDQMQHNPADPRTKASYEAMKSDVDKQWDYATNDMGVKFEPWTQQGQPYANSKEMVQDVRNNKHLYFFRGGDMPADHPLGEVDPKTGLTYNDKFRAVHDLFGHAAQGNQFGPKGEEVAYQLHRQMFSPEAVPALTSETRGQNSWVNFGKHLRDAAGNIPEKGQPGFVPQTERPYAQQKAGVLPEEFHAAAPGVTPENPKLSSSVAEHKSLADLAEEHYGVTDDPRKIGFIMPNGRGLDFSDGQNVRTLDHGDISTILKGHGNPREEFTRQTGAARFMQSSFGTEIVLPESGATPEQQSLIAKAVESHPRGKNELSVDILGKNGVEGSSRMNISEPEDIQRAIADARRDARSRAARREAATVENPKLAAGSVPEKIDDFLKNEKGEPMVFYHGSPNKGVERIEFKPGKNSTIFGSEPTQRAGLFVTPDKEFASEFAGENGEVTAHNLNIKKPADLRNGISAEFYNEMTDKGVNGRWLLSSQEPWEMFDGESGQHFVKALKSAGYDGAVISESDGQGKPVDSYIAFSPEQISKVNPENPKLAAKKSKDQTEVRPKGSTVGLLDNPLKIKPSDGADRPSTIDVAMALSKFTKKQLPALELGKAEPEEQVERAKKIMEDEARYQLAQNNNGAAWYTTDMKKHDEILQNMRPELENPAKLSLFKMVEAVLSSGQKPYANFKSAVKAWDYYNAPDSGQFPEFNPETKKSWGPRGIKAYGDAISSINRLINEHGEEGASKWLLADHSVRELREYNKNVRGRADDIIPGVMILGPKRGPFSQNLHGLESAFTADMWVSRSWHRWMGTAEIAPDGELYTDRPRSDKERELMKQSFAETADKLGMTTSSLQAVLWYYEQALYDAHGSPKESWSFATAAQRVADEEFNSFKFGEEEPAAGLEALKKR